MPASPPHAALKYRAPISLSLHSEAVNSSPAVHAPCQPRILS